MKLRMKLVSSFCLALFVAWITLALAQESMVDFRISVDALEKKAVDAIMIGCVPVYPDKALYKAASPKAQAALVQNTLSWLKTHTESQAFKAEYRKQREEAKPSAPMQVSADEKYSAYLAQQRRGLEQAKQQMGQMPPEMQKQMQEALRQMEAGIEEAAKDPKMGELMKEGMEQESAAERQAYEQRLAAWERRYPQDPKALIASRLRQFMEMSQSVAFDAELVPHAQGKIMKFADPAYESQTREWKLCYRAGRSAVQAARAFVAEWLSEIQ